MIPSGNIEANKPDKIFHERHDVDLKFDHLPHPGEEQRTRISPKSYRRIVEGQRRERIYAFPTRIL